MLVLLIIFWFLDSGLSFQEHIEAQVIKAPPLSILYFKISSSPETERLSSSWEAKSYGRRDKDQGVPA